MATKLKGGVVNEVPDDADGFEERVARLNEALKASTQPIGLYLREVYIAPQRESEGSTAIVYAEFALGDLAFSDRVQNPEREAENDRTRLALAEAEMDDTTAEVLAERWQKWKEKGGDDGNDDPGGPDRDDQGGL